MVVIVPRTEEGEKYFKPPITSIGYQIAFLLLEEDYGHGISCVASLVGGEFFAATRFILPSLLLTC